MDITEEYLRGMYGNEAIDKACKAFDKDKTIPLVKLELKRLCEESLLTRNVKKILEKHK